MGRHYLGLGKTDDEAINTFINFIKLRPLDDETQKIYDLLEPVCQIDETTSALEKMTRMDYIKRICDANPLIEWAQFYRGVGHFLNGDFSEGISRLIDALNLNSGRPLLYYWLGMGFLHQFDFDPEKVFSTFRTFIDFSFEEEQLLFKQGEAAYELGKLTINKIGGFDTSIDISDSTNIEVLVESHYYFQIANTKDEKNSKYLFDLGRTFSLQTDSKNAIKYFRRAVRYSPKNKEYHYTLAQEFMKTNSLENAVKNLNKALAIDDEYESAHSLLAEIYLLLNNYEKAEEHCRALISNGVEKLEYTLKLIHALYYQNKFNDIIEEIGESKFPLNTDYQNEVAFFIARALAKNDSLELSINWYERLPESSRNYYYMGCTLATIGNLDAALSYFDKVLKLGNGFSNQSLIQQAKVLMKLDKSEDAETKLKKALESDENNPEPFLTLGQLYFNSGDYKNAQKLFRKTLKLNSKDYMARYGIGIIRELSEQYPEAIKEYERALKSYDSQMIKLRLGILLCKVGEYQNSFDVLLELEDSGLSSDSLLFYLGMSALYSGEIGKALVSWQELAGRYPEDDELKTNIIIAHYLFGAYLIEQNRYGEAIPQWEIYFNQNNEDNKFKNELAEIYFRAAILEITKEKPNYEYAKSLMSRAIELHSESFKYQFFYALFHFGSGEYQESDSRLSEILEKNPSNIRAQYHRGLALLNLGEKEKSIKIFEKLIENEDKSTYESYAAWILANEQISNGKYNEAVSLMEVI